MWSRAPRSEASDEEAFVPVERMHPRERRVEYFATRRVVAEDGFGFGRKVGGDARALRERLTREGVAEIRAARAATREAAAARRVAEAARRRAETGEAAKAAVKRNRSATEATRTAARRAEAPRRRRTRTEPEPTPRPEPEPEPEPAVRSDDAAIGRNETPSAAGPARGAISAFPESAPPSPLPRAAAIFPAGVSPPPIFVSSSSRTTPGPSPVGYTSPSRTSIVSRARATSSRRDDFETCAAARARRRRRRLGESRGGDAPTTI